MNKKILLIEDEDLLASFLTEKLQTLGYGVLRAKNGEEGVSFTKEETPDFIITDILLPVMDGIEMIKTIRSEDSTCKNIPIMVLTNLEKVDELSSLMKNPKDIILKKTYYTLENLISIIEKQIQK